jgi:hypothetical protein
MNDIAPATAPEVMYVVGAVEILAGILVALKPRYGGYVVAAWLGAIIVNLVTLSGYRSGVAATHAKMRACPSIFRRIVAGGQAPQLQLATTDPRTRTARRARWHRESLR